MGTHLYFRFVIWQQLACMTVLKIYHRAVRILHHRCDARHHGFPDVKARVAVLLQQQHTMAMLGQQGRRGTASRSSAGHDDIIGFLSSGHAATL